VDALLRIVGVRLVLALVMRATGWSREEAGARLLGAFALFFGICAGLIFISLQRWGPLLVLLGAIAVLLAVSRLWRRSKMGREFYAVQQSMQQWSDANAVRLSTRETPPTASDIVQVERARIAAEMAARERAKSRSAR
jgi:hypothetical protein